MWIFYFIKKSVFHDDGGLFGSEPLAESSRKKKVDGKVGLLTNPRVEGCLDWLVDGCPYYVEGIRLNQDC